MKPLSLALAVSALLIAIATSVAGTRLHGSIDPQVDEALSFAAGADVKAWSALQISGVRWEWLDEALPHGGGRALLVTQTCDDNPRTEVLTVRAPGAASTVPPSVAYLRISEHETFTVRRESKKAAALPFAESETTPPSALRIVCRPSGRAAWVAGLEDAAATLSHRSTLLRPFTIEWSGYLLEFTLIPNPKFSRGWRAVIAFDSEKALQDGFNGVTSHLARHEAYPAQTSDWRESFVFDSPPLARYWTYLLEDGVVVRVAMTRNSFGPNSVGDGKVEILLTAP